VSARSASSRACALLVACAALVACGGGDDGPSAERFCGEIDANRETLTDPTIASPGDIEPLLDLYRRIADLAPLSIETEWRQVTGAYEAFSTVVPNDQQSEQSALAEMYASEESAAKVARWLMEHCAVDIGPVATLVPHDG